MIKHNREMPLKEKIRERSLGAFFIFLICCYQKIFYHNKVQENEIRMCLEKSDGFFCHSNEGG
ncbi:hypothetical protein HMPREF1987_02095 [Peptostreptococcaceae bacterium oral taxon 113 str. W5053]|nr:hypothetical protein HMPREF1987_02095 [Peptostreptococcaceae bacterium oral taxon 113 str. W5053]